MPIAGMKTDFMKRGGLWVLGQGALLLAVLVGGVVWRNQWRNPLVILCGAFLLLTSAFCGIAGTIALGRNLTPFPEPSSSGQFVQTGIYSLMRHPLYTAVTCGALGWALVWASWPALVPALALGPFFDAKARREERWLRLRFPEYDRYQKRVKRFLPRVY
jgi:protein-S-isoprenylcysteine O-methyltransferase Ste14